MFKGRYSAFALALGIAFALACAQAAASITFVGYGSLTFGSTTTSQVVNTVTATPSPGNLRWIAVITGTTPGPTVSISPSPSADTWSQVSCSGSDGYTQTVFYNYVQTGDSTNWGTIELSSAAGGAYSAGMASSGFASSSPITICQHAAIAMNASPQLGVAMPYQSMAPIGMVETVKTPSPCSTPCAGTGWTETSYAYGTVTNIMVESEVGTTQGLQDYTFAPVLTSSATIARLLTFGIVPSGTPLSWCTPELTLIGAGIC